MCLTICSLSSCLVSGFDDFAFFWHVVYRRWVCFRGESCKFPGLALLLPTAGCSAVSLEIRECGRGHRSKEMCQVSNDGSSYRSRGARGSRILFSRII